MADAKHTPWAAVPIQGIWYLKNARGDTLARFTIGSHEEAKLSAAAPDLLDALTDLLGETIDALTDAFGEGPEGDTLEDQPVVKRARAAIAKATDNG